MDNGCDTGTMWDRRFADDAYFYGEAPNAFLTACVSGMPPGRRALLPGDGEGRNGVWLARQGFAVTAVDASERGLAKAHALAARDGVVIETIRADLTTWRAPETAFDLVAVIFLHMPSSVRPELHANLARSLVPGGLLVLEGFSLRQLDHQSGGPRDSDLLFTTDRMRNDFAGMLIIEHLEETVAELNEGAGHDGPGSVVRLIARRP